MSIFQSPASFATERSAIDYIAACEMGFERQAENLAARLCADPDLHLIGLSGPTCAGKTTAGGLIIHQLEEAGRRVHMISVDDFFKEQPQGKDLINDPDGAEKLDFDSIDALDFDLFSTCLDELMTKGKTQIPRFNIGAGVREGIRELQVMGDEDVFLIEGIQVVYPEINALLHRYHYQSVFIRPATALDVGGRIYEPNEIRLMRRLVRDYYFRDSDAAFTFFAWDSVRDNEERSIFPYADDCDHQLNSLMGYEIGMLRPHLEIILRQLPYSSAYRSHADAILDHISAVQPLPVAWLPAHALYREFVPTDCL